MSADWLVLRVYKQRPKSIAKIWFFKARKQAEKFATVREKRYTRSFYHVVQDMPK